MRISMLKSAVDTADAITLARMELLLIELASTKREPTDSERTFLEDNVPLMREVAEEIARHATQEAEPSAGDA
jgi:hypothetical protein